MDHDELPHSFENTFPGIKRGRYFEFYPELHGETTNISSLVDLLDIVAEEFEQFLGRKTIISFHLEQSVERDNKEVQQENALNCLVADLIQEHWDRFCFAIIRVLNNSHVINLIKEFDSQKGLRYIAEFDHLLKTVELDTADKMCFQGSIYEFRFLSEKNVRDLSKLTSWLMLVANGVPASFKPSHKSSSLEPYLKVEIGVYPRMRVGDDWHHLKKQDSAIILDWLVETGEWKSRSELRSECKIEITNITDWKNGLPPAIRELLETSNKGNRIKEEFLKRTR